MYYTNKLINETWLMHIKPIEYMAVVALNKKVSF